MVRLGIDLGGTSVKYGLVEDGRILCRGRIPTPREEGYEAVLDAIAGAGRQLLESSGAEGAGLAVPGLVDARAGTVLYSNNFGWENRPVAADLAKRLGLPVRIANDAQAAALGEAVYGAGKGRGRFAMVTLGTGVGGGFIRDGKLDGDLYGGMAYIFGHLLYMKGGRRCTCGRSGCYEAYASARALENSYAESAGQIKTAKDIFASVPSDPSAEAAVRDFSEALGSLLADIVNAFRPEAVAVGGGAAGAAADFLPAVRRAAEQAYGWQYAPAEIVPAALGSSAGIIGAAILNTAAHRGE